MTMAIRNFYATIKNDKGVKASTGGNSINIKIQQRSHGSSMDALMVYCDVTTGGNLRLTVENSDGETIHTFTTER
jgi:hypothetical protein